MKRLIKLSKHHTKRGLSHLRDHIVPHEGNSHQPHVLKHKVLVGYSVLLVLLKVLAIVMPVALPSSSLYSSAITPQNIIGLTNQTRENLNLATLSVSDRLSQAAADKAQDMAVNKYFAHVSPTGVTPWSWMLQAGYKYKYAGENLAVHFTSAEGVQEGWLASPSHRANIVNSNYTEIGIGVAMGEFEGYPTTFVVQMFGAPTTTAQPVATVTVPPSSPVQVAMPTSPADTTPTAPQQPEVAGVEPSVEVEPVINEQPVIDEQPVVVEPLLEPIEDAPLPVYSLPIIDEASVAIMQHDGYYDIRLRISNAKSVSAYLGSDWSQLMSDSEENDIWLGRVAYDQSVVSKHGEQLSVVATSPDGLTERFALAWVAPQTKVQNLYTFNEGSNRYAKLFGFITIHNLNDSVRQFYFFFVVFITAALLINILVKIRVQKITVIGHTVFVLALAVLLSVI